MNREAKTPPAKTELSDLLRWILKPWGSEDGPEIDALMLRCESALEQTEVTGDGSSVNTEMLEALENCAEMLGRDFIKRVNEPILGWHTVTTQAQTAIARAKAEQTF